MAIITGGATHPDTQNLRGLVGDRHNISLKNGGGATPEEVRRNYCRTVTADRVAGLFTNGDGAYSPRGISGHAAQIQQLVTTLSGKYFESNDPIEAASLKAMSEKIERSLKKALSDAQKRFSHPISSDPNLGVWFPIQRVYFQL